MSARTIATAVLAAVASVLGVTAPAQAAPAWATTPFCVTTTWQAVHSHQPKTQPGQACLVGVARWTPSSWPEVGTAVRGSQAFEVIRRPR